MMNPWAFGPNYSALSISMKWLPTADQASEYLIQVNIPPKKVIDYKLINKILFKLK